jgi:hypothetical protein
MIKYGFGIMILLLMSTGCATPPMVRYVHNHDPIMDKNGGVVLLIDVCNQVDVVGQGDYCVINESKEVASAVAEPLITYLEQNGVSVKTEMIPFVCGASDTPDKIAKVAQKEGDTVNEAPKPYAIGDEFQEDKEYLNALTTLSTCVLERSVTGKTDDSMLLIPEEEFKEAMRIVRSKTNASSLVYVGIKGRMISGGKKFAQGLLRFTTGVATAVATAGMGTGYVVTYMPGGDVDGKLLLAGLVNMENEELSWKNYYSAQGDPLDVKEMNKYYRIDSLLKGLVYDKEILPTERK